MNECRYVYIYVRMSSAVFVFCSSFFFGGCNSGKDTLSGGHGKDVLFGGAGTIENDRRRITRTTTRERERVNAIVILLFFFFFLVPPP